MTIECCSRRIKIGKLLHPDSSTEMLLLSRMFIWKKTHQEKQKNKHITGHTQCQQQKQVLFVFVPN